MNEAGATVANYVEDRGDALDVDALGHLGGQFARFEFAGAFAIQHGDELVFVEQLGQHLAVIAVAGDDSLSLQRPIVLAPDADDVLAELAAEVVEGVVAGYA